MKDRTVKKFWKHNKGSLYFSADSYTDNEINIRICDISCCDWTMIKKSSLVFMGLALENREETYETRKSDFESHPLFGFRKTKKGYTFYLYGIFNMDVEIPTKNIDEIVLYLKSL